MHTTNPACPCCHDRQAALSLFRRGWIPGMSRCEGRDRVLTLLDPVEQCAEADRCVRASSSDAGHRVVGQDADTVGKRGTRRRRKHGPKRSITVCAFSGGAAPPCYNLTWASSGANCGCAPASPRRSQSHDRWRRRRGCLVHSQAVLRAQCGHDPGCGSFAEFQNANRQQANAPPHGSVATCPGRGFRERTTVRGASCQYSAERPRPGGAVYRDGVSSRYAESGLHRRQTCPAERIVPGRSQRALDGR
ncbi:hypothetical protein BC628DRAFT_788754 [Trametes gibbosa]|nr:hypothetical protein BC628DRAFT_788754 [Trametes gibbosa]